MTARFMYDTVITSGGIAGFTAALRIAREGGRVAIVEPRGCLLWELGKARQWPGELSVLQSDPLSSNIFLSRIEALDIIRNGCIEPVLVELAADRLVREAGVDVFLESRPVLSDACRTAYRVVLAQKGRMQTILARQFVQFDKAGNSHKIGRPGADVYSITFANGSAEKKMDTIVRHASGEAAVRVRRSAWESEWYADIAYPFKGSNRTSSELEFATDFDRIILGSKEQIPGLGKASPIYMSDEPWRWNTESPKAHISVCQGTDKTAVGAEAAGSSFSWSGCEKCIQHLFLFGEEVGIEALK